MRKERAVERLAPERDELVQHREFRRDVVVLPDECLQEVRVVWKMIQKLRRGEAVALQHHFGFAEILHCGPSNAVLPYQCVSRRVDRPAEKCSGRMNVPLNPTC
jgi:hypothetical protein